MIDIPMNTKDAFDRQTLSDINHSFMQEAVNAQTIFSVNKSRIANGSTGSARAGNFTDAARAGGSAGAARTAGTSPGHTTVPAPAGALRPTGTRSTGVPAQTGRGTDAPIHAETRPEVPVAAKRQIPPLRNPIRKGQKTVLAPGRPLPAIHACFGWETTDPRCDLDVSAFLLTESGKVPGDSWFVFYGQRVSPDQSTSFHDSGNAADREMIDIQFTKLNPSVKKIVFVLTINDALENKLNFGMVKDAYVRILDADGKTELAGFRMTDYYSNVISMMIGEIYLHNGVWKFNAIGNGVARDLAGLCELYGVEVSN